MKKKVLEKQDIRERPIDFLLEFIPKDLSINSYQISGIYFYSKLSYKRNKVEAHIVTVFNNPNVPSSERDIFIETMPMKSLEVSKHNDTYYMMMDISRIKNPPNSQFRDIILDMKKPMKLKGFEVYGQQLPTIKLDQFKLHIIFHNNKEAFFDQLRKKYKGIKQMIDFRKK